MGGEKKEEPDRDHTHDALLLGFANYAPVFAHEFDVASIQSGGQINLSIGNTSIDLQFSQRSPVHKNKKENCRVVLHSKHQVPVFRGRPIAKARRSFHPAPDTDGTPPRRVRKGSASFRSQRSCRKIATESRWKKPRCRSRSLPRERAVCSAAFSRKRRRRRTSRKEWR